MPETVGMVLDRLEQKAAMTFELPPNGTSLDLLRAIYRSPKAELTMRIRCAMACLQFEHPKLGISVQVNEEGFAELLERRLKHMKQVMNGTPLIEAKPQQAVEIQPMPPTSTDVRPPLAPTNDRRFRRM
jgi:hypothetical protein